jgi:hypothetical protein
MQDGSSPVYVKDDDMLQLLMVLMSTAGYAENTVHDPSLGLMPFGESLAALGPVLTMTPMLHWS